MNLDFPIEETVKSRSSVRTYEDRPLSSEAKEQINAYSEHHLEDSEGEGVGISKGHILHGVKIQPEPF